MKTYIKISYSDEPHYYEIYEDTPALRQELLKLGGITLVPNDLNINCVYPIDEHRCFQINEFKVFN